MAYTIDKNILVEGSLTQVDDMARFPLGFIVTDNCGNEYAYVKATAALTAGTAVASASRSSLTVTSSSAFDGGFKVSNSVPGLSQGSNFGMNELRGTLVKITRDSSVLGLFPITGGIYDGSHYVIYCPEVKTGDTVAFGRGPVIASAGGTASTKAGAINVTPICNVAQYKFAFVAINAPVQAA